MEYHLIPDRIGQELLQPNSVLVGEPHSGGLSGAVVWRAQSRHGPVALRRWPDAHPTPERLALIHTCLVAARDSGELVLPELYRNRSGGTFTSDGQRLWELAQWMPGVANYAQAPTLGRLRAAMRQLASLHRMWGQATSVPAAPSPTVVERCQRLRAWIARLPELTHGVPRMLASRGDDFSPLRRQASETLGQLARRGAEMISALMKWQTRPVALHFVLRDIWSEHVLFTDEHVTGIIDFGAARVDEPATDVARLLGSLEPLDAHRWQLGWESYHEINPQVERHRVADLDRVATLLSALQWLEWLVIQPRQFDAPLSELAMRWERLLARMEAD